MASVHNVLIEEWAGLVIGLFTGVLVMVGIIILKPILFEFTTLRDLRNILSTFFIPSLVGAFGGIIAAAIYPDSSKTGFGGQSFEDFFGFTTTARRNFGGWAISLGFGFAAAAISGIIVNLLRFAFPRFEVYERLQDDVIWHVHITLFPFFIMKFPISFLYFIF